MIKNTREKRKELIKAIEDERKSKLIIYVTGDRIAQPSNLRIFPTQVAPDVLDLLDYHLRKIGKVTRIDLFLYTTGGYLNAPWPIVNLIRCYCDYFSVLVPYKALSAGTLIALGANEIIMTNLGLLSPVDPKGHFQDPTKGPIEFSVEDVIGFIKLAKDKVGVGHDQASEILRLLSQGIPPPVLGSVNRTYLYIRDLSEKLLSLHLSSGRDKRRIKRIVKYLVEKLSLHEHFINRKEAKDIIGLPVFNAEDAVKGDKLDSLILELWSIYSRELELTEPFFPKLYLEDKSEKTGLFKRAFLESADITHVYESEFTVSITKTGININENKGKWEIKEGDTT